MACTDKIRNKNIATRDALKVQLLHRSVVNLALSFVLYSSFCLTFLKVCVTLIRNSNVKLGCFNFHDMASITSVITYFRVTNPKVVHHLAFGNTTQMSSSL